MTVSDTAGNTATADIAFPAVAKGDQTLAGFLYSSASVTYGSEAPTLTAPTGVETTLSYSTNDSAVCTVNAGTGALTIAGVGSCIITATAAGTDDYNEASVTFTVTVGAIGTLVLNVGAIATDNTVNIAEKAAGFAIAGDTGPCGRCVGDRHGGRDAADGDLGRCEPGDLVGERAGGGELHRRVRAWQ